MTLLLGDATTTYSAANSNVAKNVSAFQFTAAGTGTIDTLEFRTSGVANTGMTSLLLGVYADQLGSPGTLLGSGTFTGTPAINSWISVTGLTIPVVATTKYWIGFDPLGGTIHYNTSVVSGGTPEADYNSSQTTLNVSGGAWGASTSGPMGLQGIASVTSALLPEQLRGRHPLLRSRARSRGRF